MRRALCAVHHCLANPRARLLQAKGGDFTGDDKDFLRVKLGKDALVPGFEEAIRSMRAGGVRRVVVPVELGYPDNDFNKAGPKPQ